MYLSLQPKLEPMKHLLTILTLALGLSATTTASAQTDHNGNPVFNSIPMGEDSLSGGFRLLANYYTMEDNIDNKGSSVYIADQPTADQIATAATRLPADNFILLKGRTVIKIILVNYFPQKWILVVTPGVQEPKKYKNPLKGEIAENRANELIKEKYDPAATIQDGVLTFNNSRYTITPNEKTKAAVMELIKKEHFDVDVATGVKVLSKEELHAMILKETGEGGKLDFFTPIKGKEMEGIQVKPGLFATRREYALIKWGEAAWDLGVMDLDEAYSIFADFRGRALNMPEKESIKFGFEKKLDK